jgi:lysophospholipase L1-like esterase
MDKIRLVAIVVFMLATTISEKSNANPLVSSNDRIWLVGDSNGYLLMQELPSLAKSDGIVFGGSPVPGSSVIQWTNSNDEYIELNKLSRFKPTVILVCLGSNDAYMGPRIIKNEQPFLNALLGKLSRNNRRVIWIGPPKLEKAKSGLEQFYQMVSPKVTYLDSRLIDVDMWDDKLHPSFSGRKKWANWIWEKLTK